MYIAGASTDDVYQYTLSTAWDLSTASYASKNLAVSGFTNLSGCMFNDDGTVLFVTEYNTETIKQYNLSTAYDISTATDSGISNNIYPASEPYGTPLGVFFKPDGKAIFPLPTGQDTVLKLNTIKPGSVEYDSAISFTSTPSAPSLFATDILTFKTTDAGVSFEGGLAVKGAK
jgi:DNA-binding beta-propeller fold protein YncE